MKNLFRLFSFCLCFCMVLATFESCSEKKVYNSEVEVIGDGGSRGRHTYVNYQGKAYTGQVWANDESCYQTFENGIITGGVIFHKNGKKALVVKMPKNDDRSFEFYDERGNAIGEEEFYNNYRDLMSETNHKLPIK